jgi:tetratricopeptide (TPR) repeat protein
MPPKHKKGAAASAAVVQQSPAQAAAELAAQQVLPPKESALFKQLLAFYERKQYKKAIKASDAILKRFPSNGETISMRGLVVSQQGKLDEAYSLVKKGLSCNIKSHVCWHVYGLIYRQDRKYDDAIKCYQNALKRDAENLQILKDLANLQVQRKMYEGFQETRRKILILKANNQNNWIAFAISAHLNQKYEHAIDIIDKYLSTEQEEQKNTSNFVKKLNYEDSELRLYRYSILKQSGQLQTALDYLNSIEPEVTDKFLWKEEKATLHNSLGQKDLSEKFWRELINFNPDNHKYHKGLTTTMGLVPDEKSQQYSSENTEKLLQLYSELSKQYPKANSAKRIPLDFTQGAAFKQLASNHMKEYLRKGIPSLFNDILPLLSHSEKAKIIQEISNNFLKNLRKSNKFDDSDAENSESPSVLLWALYFAGHLHDHFGNIKQNSHISMQTTLWPHSHSDDDGQFFQLLELYNPITLHITTS